MKYIGILANIHKPAITNVLQKFFDDVKMSKRSFFILDDIKKVIPQIPNHIKLTKKIDDFSDIALIAAFGGDGTILRAAQMVGSRQIPILGVNMGGLGFLTVTSPEKAFSSIEKFLENNLKVESRSVLKLSIKNENKSYFALNDFVIDKSGFARPIKITVWVEGMLLNSYIADGLIISTPTGSTAYSLANGGPIIMPTTRNFIINPICPHTLSNRPVVISDDVKIRIAVQSELNHFNIFGDGQNLGVYSCEQEILFCNAGYTINLIQTPEQEFYSTLREKLGWGDDFRNKNQ